VKDWRRLQAFEEEPTGEVALRGAAGSMAIWAKRMVSNGPLRPQTRSRELPADRAREQQAVLLEETADLVLDLPANADQAYASHKQRTDELALLAAHLGSG
jgi:hypothetical protein